MIIDFFLYLFYSLINFLIGLFPTGSLDSSISSSFVSLWDKISLINSWVNLDVLFSVFGIFLATEVLILTFHSGIFIYNKIRGSG